MSIQVETALFAFLSDCHEDGQGGRHPRIYEMPEGSTVQDIAERLSLPDQKRIVLVNGIVSCNETALKDGDRLAIFPPIAGG